MKEVPVPWTEKDIARRVVDYLISNGCEVHSEVVCSSLTDSVPDIVAVTSIGELWIVEVKKTLSLAVMEQAYLWKMRRCAHLVSVAVPEPKRNTLPTGRRFARHALKTEGLGLFEVSKHRAKESIAPSQLAIRDGGYGIDALRSALCDENLWDAGAAAGTVGGGRWTPFRATITEIAKIVEEHPSIKLSKLVREYGPWHYATKASARGALRTQLEREPGFVCFDDGSLLYVEERKERVRRLEPLSVSPIEEQEVKEQEQKS